MSTHRSVPLGFARRSAAAAIWLVASLVACSSGSSEEAAPAAAKDRAGEKSAATAPSGGAGSGKEGSGASGDEQPAPDHVRTATYDLRAIAETQYAADRPGQFSVELKPKEGWHVNMDYPFAVEVEAPDSVKLPKKRFEKADAASYTEDGVRLDVPMTPTGEGERRIEIEVDFAVCTPDSCVPETRTLSVSFRVGA